MKNHHFQNWAFIAPRMSADMSVYFSGILDVVKYDPAIFLHSFVFDDPNLDTIRKMDGIISCAMPPPHVMKILSTPHPPMVVITMCPPKDPTIAYAHIDPMGVAERVVDTILKRHCRSYAFCSTHTPHLRGESASLLRAYRRTILARTRQKTLIFHPVSTMDINLIPSDIERFAEWFAKVPKPCGMFVHGDNVARRMLDACRLKGIAVPDELRVIGTGNSPVFCERTFPTLSSYAIDHLRAGSDAARVLMRLIAGEVTPRTASYEIPLPDVSERASSLDACGRARIAEATRAFIERELEHGHTPTTREITFHLNVSFRKIENDFRAVIGHTLREEITMRRLDLLCRDLKASNEPIKTLVERSGFGDMSCAVRTFKKRLGMTMSEYRAQPEPS